MLRSAPSIEDGNLVDARNGAMRSAALFGEIFTAHVIARVSCEWHARIAALLRAVMHQPILTNVEVAGAGTASPRIGQTLSDVVLEGVDAGEAALLPRLHFVVDPALFATQRLQLATSVMNDSDGGTETEFDGAFADGERILRIRNATAHHGIDIHMKFGVLGQPLQFLVENFQALLRNIVGIDVVDGNLQPLESGAIQALDAFGDEQVSVGDKPGNHAVGADA